MARATSVTDIVMQLAQSGRLRFRVLDFIRGATDVVAILDDKFEGRGTSFGEDTALCKAAMEAVERKYISENQIATSNGWAIREMAEAAIDSAKAEAVERDVFAAHLLASHPFYVCEAIENAVARAAVKALLNDHQVALDIFELRRSSDYRVTIAVANQRARPDGFGIIVGLGSHRDLQSSMHQAFFECSRNVLACLHNPLAFSGPRKAALSRDYAETFLRTFTPALKQNAPVAQALQFETETFALGELTIAHASFANQFSLVNVAIENENQVDRLRALFGDDVRHPFLLSQPLG